MKPDIIHTLTNTFEAHAQQTDEGIEFGLARGLRYLLGYTRWGNFLKVISKAETACETSHHAVSAILPTPRVVLLSATGPIRNIGVAVLFLAIIYTADVLQCTLKSYTIQAAG